MEVKSPKWIKCMPVTRSLILVLAYSSLTLLLASCNSGNFSASSTGDSIHLDDQIDTAARPPFSNCSKMQTYFNNKYASDGIRTSFSEFSSLPLLKKAIDYNANAHSQGKKTVGDIVLVCSGGIVTTVTDEYTKKCIKSNMFYYTLVEGRTILAWSELGQINAPVSGKWINIGPLDSDISRGECSFSW